MTDYPEKRPPLSPIGRFTFNVHSGEAAATDLQLRIDALEERIDRIVKKVTLHDVRIITHLLALSSERDDLERLGKALLRVAPLVTELAQLRDRLRVIALARENPEWLAWAFGDFTDELDQLTTELTTLTGDDEE